MSAESTLAFYGVFFEVADDEITSLEERSHPLLAKARQNGLHTYWGNFASEGSKCLLFVGEKLGIIGFENDREIHLPLSKLKDRAIETDARLHRAGVFEQALLHLVWQPDS